MAKEIHKLQQLSQGDKDPHVQQLYVNFKELTESHNALVDACNKNFGIYSQQFQILDMRAGAVFSAVQDLLNSLEVSAKDDETSFISKVLVVKPAEGQDGTARVDWQKYMQHYLDTVRVEMVRLDAARQQARDSGLIPAEDALQPSMATPITEREPLVTPAGALNEEAEIQAPDTVFGGDHAEIQQSTPAT